MDKHLSLIDSAFTNQYKSLLEIQQGIAKQLERYSFDLSKNEITTAVYERMMAFWYFHVNNCTDLGRKVNTVAADFFTETCVFFLKPCLKQKGYEVYSEKNIRENKNRLKIIRPDLSIWKENQLAAVIELKVSDGWKGKTMTKHLDNRKKEIQEIWPGAFFGAISFWNCFGDGFKTDDSEYIGLYNFDKGNVHKATGKTIEQIITRAIKIHE